MPGPVAVAAIGAGAQVLGGWMGSKGASRAAKAQARSQQAALHYQLGRDRITDERYKQAWDDYGKRYATWEEMTRSQLGMARPSSGAAAAPVTLGDLAGAQPAGQSAPAPATGGSLGEMASGGPDWTDWRRYGA